MSDRATPGELAGDVISVENDRATVRLSTGETGVVDPAGGLAVGQRATFQIKRREEGKPPILGLVRREASSALPSFDQEVNRLHDALANHHPANSYQQPQHDILGEDRIQPWVNRVEQRLATLRRNRAKRLDEEFYNG